MRDLQTTVAENNAFAEGSKACEEGVRALDCPYPLHSGRVREFWLRGWNKKWDKLAEERGWY